MKMIILLSKLLGDYNWALGMTLIASIILLLKLLGGYNYSRESRKGSDTQYIGCRH